MAEVSVSDAKLDHLEQELEGWIVGLHLVGLVLRNQPDPEAFLSGLKRVDFAWVRKHNTNATLCQILVSENVEALKEKVSNRCGLRLYRVGGIGLKRAASTMSI